MLSSSSLFLLLICWWCWEAIGSSSFYKNDEPIIFPLGSNFVDFRNGSMDSLSAWLRLHPITLVVYYASWSGQCLKAVPEIIKTHNVIRNNPGFSVVGINCWHSECQKNFNTPHFPRVFLYHTHHRPIEYFDEVLTNKMVEFLRNSIRPFTHIGCVNALKRFQQENDNHILAFMNPTEIPLLRKYKVVLKVALQSLTYANTPKIGIITNKDIASTHGLLKHGYVSLNSRFNEKKVYPANFNYTSQDIINWISANSRKLVNQLTPHIYEREYYTKQLKHPALILTSPSLLSNLDNGEKLAYYPMLYEAASRYYNCSSCYQEKRQIIKRSKMLRESVLCRDYIILKDFLYLSEHICFNKQPTVCGTERLYTVIDPYLRVTYIRYSTQSGHLPRRVYRDNYQWCRYRVVSVSLLKKYGLSAGFVENEALELKRLPKMVTLKDILHDLNVTEPIVNILSKDSKDTFRCGSNAPCCHKGRSKMPHGSIDGLACRTNKTLNFYVLDAIRYEYLVTKVLGVEHKTNESSIFVVDLQSKTHHLMGRAKAPSALERLILDYTNDNLNPHYASIPSQHHRQPLHKEIVELSSSSFNKEVLENDQNVLVMFYANWCGVCKPANLMFLKLLHQQKDSKVKFARIDNDLHDLPWHLTASTYPSFILFPAQRKEDSIAFPTDKEMTMQNFAHFLSTSLS